MKLFICYRPADLADVERLHDGLVAAFGFDPVIRDPEAVPIPFASRRAAYVEDWLRAASAVLVVIGPGWLDAIDARGRRRLRRADDPVRLEIEAAHSLGIPLVPVLVGGARLPAAQALPGALRALCGRPAHVMRRGAGFAADLDGLAADLVRLHERPVQRVTRLTHRSRAQGWLGWWEARFRMRAEHAVVYERKGFPYHLRLKVDGRLVWSKRCFSRLPTLDLPFRIESENADCWLVLEDYSNSILMAQSVQVWVENTNVLHLVDPDRRRRV